jgi:3-phenylpropionate/trans-cinnamate dioxygenase ferredoxin reductase subunit
MSSSCTHVVIVGAGHAGGTLAALLRQYGHTGPVSLIGEEPHPSYQRPPLGDQRAAQVRDGPPADRQP